MSTDEVDVGGKDQFRLIAMLPVLASSWPLGGLGKPYEKVPDGIDDSDSVTKLLLLRRLTFVSCTGTFCASVVIQVEPPLHV
jgi:hypothetical protein